MHQKTNDALSEIRSQIESGEFSAMDFLPPERVLCRRYKIGRGALRVVFSLLEEENVLRRIPGKGLKILSVAERSPQLKMLLVIPSNGVWGEEIAALLHGCAVAAEQDNVELVLSFLPEEPSLLHRLAKRILEAQWDGVIFLEQFPAELAETLQKANCRYCIANCEDNGTFPAVRVDFRAVGRMAGRFLVEHGYRHIGFLGFLEESKTFLYKEMLAGLKGALAEDDMAPEQNAVILFETGDDAPCIKTLTERLKNITFRPYALFAGRDHWARLAFEVCKTLSLRIPQDVAILGYDGLSWNEAVQNGLSDIRQPAIETGSKAVHLLTAAAKNGTDLPPLTLIPPGQLFERNSTGMIKG